MHVSEPIKRSMDAFHTHVRSRLSQLTGEPLEPLSVNQLVPADREVASQSFNAVLLHEKLHGGQSVSLALPKKPTLSNARSGVARERRIHD